VPARVAYALLTLTLCAAAALIGVALAARGDSDGAVAAVGPTGFAGAVRPPGAAAPAFRLRDADGRVVRMADFRGRPIVVTFIYSHCEDTCPGQVQTIRGALDDLGRDVPVLGISVDPANDTAASAKRFVNEQRMTGRMRFVLGSERALAPIWRAYGIAPQRGQLDHSAYVVLVDGRGRQRVGFPHSVLTDADLAHDLRRLGA
jgi:protein SCO1/2